MLVVVVVVFVGSGVDRFTKLTLGKNNMTPIDETQIQSHARTHSYKQANE